jgi:hypothetical protein
LKLSRPCDSDIRRNECAMWKLILILWSIPVALGIAMIVRIARGAPAIDEDEWRIFFGSDKEAHLTLWFGIKLTLLSLLLFFLGLAEGLILINFGFLWIVLVPLVTTLGVMLILTHLLPSASDSELFAEQHDAAQSHQSEGRTPASGLHEVHRHEEGS